MICAETAKLEYTSICVGTYHVIVENDHFKRKRKTVNSKKILETVVSLALVAELQWGLDTANTLVGPPDPSVIL